jgi:putative SOS response-associated peptidase YedK
LTFINIAAKLPAAFDSTRKEELWLVLVTAVVSAARAATAAAVERRLIAPSAFRVTICRNRQRRQVVDRYRWGLWSPLSGVAAAALFIIVRGRR